MSIFFFAPSLVQWRNSVVSWISFQLLNNIHALDSVSIVSQVFPPPLLDYSEDRDGGALWHLSCHLTSPRAFFWRVCFWRWFDIWWASSFCIQTLGLKSYLNRSFIVWSLHGKLLWTESGSSPWMHLPPRQLLMLFPLNIPFGLQFTASSVLFSNYYLRRVCLVVLVLPKWEVVGRHLHENRRSVNRFLNCTINDEVF